MKFPFICWIFGLVLPLGGGHLDALLPQAGERFVSQGEPVYYTPDNLYELIDGEAELYLAYGFRLLAVRSYRVEGHEALTVHCYDMGTPENAFGIYSSYRYPDYDFQPIGTEAMVSEYGIKLYQGPYFIDIAFAVSDSTVQKAGRELALAVCQRITDPPVPPSIVHLLPPKGQIAKTLRYQASEMLNQSFLPRGIEAKYRLGEREVTAFVVLLDRPEETLPALDRLKSFYFRFQADFYPVALPGEAGIAVKTPYEGILLASVWGRYFFGIRRLPGVEEGLPLLTEILSHLKRVSP